VLFGAALSTLLISPEIVRADEASISASSSVRAVAAQPLGDLAAVAPGAEVYFGNGCFWGRQHEFVQTERTQLGRSDDEVSSLVGYAGGFSAKGKDGKVCYYYGAPDTVYERLGHGEVVRTVLSDMSPTKATEDLRAFAKTYFANFKKIRGFGEFIFISIRAIRMTSCFVHRDATTGPARLWGGLPEHDRRARGYELAFDEGHRGGKRQRDEAGVRRGKQAERQADGGRRVQLGLDLRLERTSVLPG
jgi:hypothetical protein